MRIGFVGGGNMAAALIGGLQRGGADHSLRVIERDAPRREHLRATFGVEVAEAPGPELGACDVVVLAVKPGDLAQVCRGLRGNAGRTLLLSIAAGIPTDLISAWSGNESVVRAMPNTPALIGQGVSGLFARPGVSARQRADAEAILSAVGQALWFDQEALLDAVTAISGSGPAYVFYFLEALEAAGVRMGLDAAQARRLAEHTFSGAAALAAQSPEELAVLRQRVTSKGGTTAAALAHLDAKGVGAALTEAALAACERAREMARDAGG